MIDAGRGSLHMGLGTHSDKTSRLTSTIQMGLLSSPELTSFSWRVSTGVMYIYLIIPPSLYPSLMIIIRLINNFLIDIRTRMW